MATKVPTKGFPISFNGALIATSSRGLSVEGNGARVRKKDETGGGDGKGEKGLRQGGDSTR